MGSNRGFCWIGSDGISGRLALQTVFALPLSVSLLSLLSLLSLSVTECEMDGELELGLELELELNGSGMAEHMHGVTETKAKY